MFTITDGLFSSEPAASEPPMAPLQPSFGLIVHAPDEAVQAVHLHLAQHGIRPATWRLLMRSSVRLLLAVRPMYRGPLAQTLVNHLLVLQGFALHDEPAPELVDAIWGYQGNTGYRWDEYFDEVGGCAATFGHLARCHGTQKARIAADDQPALREAMQDVVHWVHEARITALGKNERRAGWRWLVRTARAWRAAQRRRGQGSTPWPVPQPLEIGEAGDARSPARRTGRGPGHASLCGRTRPGLRSRPRGDGVDPAARLGSAGGDGAV